MRFAVNYSTKAGELVKAGSIECDLFKCPEWEGLLKAATAIKPVYLHLDITVGRDDVRKLDFDKLRKILRRHTPHVNCHRLARRNSSWGTKPIATNC